VAPDSFNQCSGKCPALICLTSGESAAIADPTQTAQQHLKDMSAIHPTVLLSNILLLSAA